MMKKLNYLFAIGLLFLFACGGGEATTEATDTVTEEAVVEEVPAVEETAKDIVALAAETEALSTLVAAVKAAGLVETLQGEGPFTVFAPTNEAFAALPEGTLENLLKPENKDQLIAILTYHVVSGDAYAKDLSNGQKIKTVEGDDVKVNINSKGVMINDATVVAADVKATNGVVHVIDHVLLPPSE